MRGREGEGEQEEVLVEEEGVLIRRDFFVFFMFVFAKERRSGGLLAKAGKSRRFPRGSKVRFSFLSSPSEGSGRIGRLSLFYHLERHSFFFPS